jgi:two-component system chemotaxis response regulator CheY
MEKLGTESPNLIVTDMNMPYMDGIEFVKNVRNDAAWKDTPIVMVTTEADEDEKKRAIEAGVDDYLVKPATAEMITDSVRKILKKLLKGA